MAIGQRVENVEWSVNSNFEIFNKFCLILEMPQRHANQIHQIHQIICNRYKAI